MKLQLEKLKDFDAYYKPIEDYHERTFIGGTVSIICWLTIIFLTSLRCYEFFTVKEVTQSIYVDSSRSPKLWINLDIVIPRISCDYVSLDAMDSSGAEHLHIDHNIYKRRLDMDGNPIEEPKKEDVGSRTTVKAETTASANETTPKCGSCYGAEDSNNAEKFNITCCNSCEEVRDAYRKRRWQAKETEFDQCKSSATAQQLERVFKEGCQVYGYMEVNRVSGAFHIAPGQSFSINHLHVHQIQPFSSSQFNSSHTIRHLSFGKTKITTPLDIPVNPLDGSVAVAEKPSSMFKYYLKIVPTMVVGEHGVLHTNQFSVTKHVKVVTPSMGDSGMPGIFFNYELSAMMVKVVSKSVPFSHLITDLCSIIGGVWIFAMFVDSVFYRSSKLLNKIELGKAS